MRVPRRSGGQGWISHRSRIRHKSHINTEQISAVFKERLRIIQRRDGLLVGMVAFSFDVDV